MKLKIVHISYKINLIIKYRTLNNNKNEFQFFTEINKKQNIIIPELTFKNIQTEMLLFKNERKAFSFKTDKEGKKYALLTWIMVLAAIIPNLLSMYNSYASDYQPQGRYSLPMIIPFFYFIAIGYGSVLRKSKNEERNVMIMVAGCVIFALLAYWLAILPAYAGKDFFYLATPLFN